MKARGLRWGVLAALGFIGFLFLTVRVEVDPPQGSPKGEPGPSLEGAGRPALVPAPGGLATEAPAESTPEAEDDPAERQALLAQAEARMQALITTYQEATVYPSWSRPADGSNRQVVEWNLPATIGQPFAEDAEGRELRGDLELSKMFVGPGEVLVARVQAHFVEDGRPAPLDEVHVSLEAFDGEGWQPAAALEPIAEGLGYRAEVVPSLVPALRAQPRDVRIRAYLKAGAMDRELSLGFRYTAAPSLMILGLASDRLDQGDLVMQVRVDVQTLAPILLQATLFDASHQRPLAVYEDYHRPTQLGVQELPVRIYGKVLHEAGLDGPYQLGRIHGFVYRQELDPREQFFAQPEGVSWETGPYRADAFRSEPYDSAEKREKLAQYRGMIGGAP